MTLHRLPAGTDVAEMALFDMDGLPHERPCDGERFDELVARKGLIRFPTGGDGGYLLHLYVNESPPAHVMQYCLTDDQLCGEFSSPCGNIAFGGVESVFQSFQPNKHIRSDTVIAPGNYTYKAYQTNIPDEAIEAALQRVPSTPAERWLDRAPMVITLTALGLVGLLLSLKIYWAAGIAAVLGHLLFKGVKRIPGHGAMSVRREHAQIDFPSIVVEMFSMHPGLANQPAPVHTVAEALARIDAFVGEPTRFVLPVHEGLMDPVGINMSLITDRILARGWAPDGFAVREGVRTYHYKRFE